MKDQTIKVVAAISSLTILESIALINKVNGALFSTVLFIIGGLGGFYLREKKEE